MRWAGKENGLDRHLLSDLSRNPGVGNFRVVSASKCGSVETKNDAEESTFLLSLGDVTSSKEDEQTVSEFAQRSRVPINAVRYRLEELNQFGEDMKK